MKRIYDTHPTLRAFGISLLLTGLLGAGAALADDASGSGSNGEEATQGGMGQEAMEEDCPEEMKYNDGECPSDWTSDSLGDEMPKENGSTGTTDGTGGTQTEGTGTDSDRTGTGGSGGTGTDGTGTDSIGTGGTGSGTGTSGTGSGGTGAGGMGTGGGN